MKLKCKLILIVVVFIFLFPQEVKAQNGSFVYYIDLDENEMEYWKREEIIFEGNFDQEEKAFIIFENLFSNEYLYSLPKATVLLDVQIQEDHLILDVSKEMKNYGGTFYETRIIDQILKTALDIPGINKVTLLIDGKLEVLPEGSYIDEAEEIICQELMEDWSHNCVQSK